MPNMAGRLRPIASPRRCVLATAALLLGAQLTSGQDLGRYRLYLLDSPLESVLATSGVGAAEVKTLHERPARIQELEWRAPYAMPETELADPVRGLVFTFFNGALYRIVVRYDRERTDGLSNDDVVDAVSAVYGRTAIRPASSLPAAAFPDGVILGHWENPTSLLTLVRDRYSRELQLILISKGASARAHAATREAIRLDAIEAPRRERQQRQREVADASAARDQRRTANKAAFKP